MRKYIIIITLAIMAAGAASCESLKLGDAGLSKAPESSGASLDTLFATIKDSDKVLASAYWYLPYGVLSKFDSKMGNDILESITDHFISNKHSDNNGPNDLYYNGGLSAYGTGGSEAYRFGSEVDYYCIRYALFYQENAPRIPVETDADKEAVARKVAEAKLCEAIAYANMARYVGGVPIMKKAIDVEKDELKFPRATFKETIDHIVNLCDEAALHLPWAVASEEDGRLTKAGALGLKLRMLCFAASPTFNSNEPWYTTGEDWESMGKYVRYADHYMPELWTEAKAAADEFMDELAVNGYYRLVQSTDVQAEAGKNAYRLAYRKGYFDRGTTESIISVRKSNDYKYHDAQIDLQDDYGCGPSLDWVNRYPYADGRPFPEDFDWEDQTTWIRQPFFTQDPTGVNKVGLETRDPRLYENICVPGDIWKDGKVGRTYDNHEHHQDGCPGFLMMKFILQQESDRNKPPHWPLMRYAEVLLNAAEAYNEADQGPSAKAYDWVNQVRARVGLPALEDGMDQIQFRNAVLLERDLEFGFEEVRWFDMVRWGLTEAFTTPLSALSSKGDHRSKATQFTYKVKEAYPPRVWYTKWNTKWYLAPIPASEVNKGYGMTQNPGWK